MIMEVANLARTSASYRRDAPHRWAAASTYQHINKLFVFRHLAGEARDLVRGEAALRVAEIDEKIRGVGRRAARGAMTSTWRPRVKRLLKERGLTLQAKAHRSGLSHGPSPHRTQAMIGALTPLLAGQMPHVEQVRMEEVNVL